MAASSKFVRRDTASVAPFAEICGDIRGLIDAKDNAAAEIYFVDVRVRDADAHFHKKTEEFYYILNGEGTMRLDGETVELHKGVVIYIPCGVVHQAEPAPGGSLHALVIAVPRGLAEDLYAPDGTQLSMY